jgi:hypothetical protein
MSLHGKKGHVKKKEKGDVKILVHLKNIAPT